MEALFNGVLQGKIDGYMQLDYKGAIGLAHNSTYVPDASQNRAHAYLPLTIPKGVQSRLRRSCAWFRR
ncbi:MAG: hypothetical protein KJP23_18125 [Deltaproteobacteria bacterium]|nr:hypothetical protein [Deltaproteobacteria bacterium]